MNFGNNLYQWFLSNAQSLVPVSYTHLSAQLDEEFFRSHSDIVIENNFSIEQVELAAQKAAEAINNLMR